MPSELRVGLTMREVHPSGYDEPRDALARAWGPFMAAALPDAAWLPVPNLGAAAATRFCAQWGVNGLILTGGEDLGVAPLRDETERALLRRCLGEGLPVLGVCRGLQLMWTELGGTLEPIPGHVAVRHRVRVSRVPSGDSEDVREVNSFHGLGLRGSEAALHEPVTVFARADDGSIEGLRFRTGKAVGVMWHPERDAAASAGDVALMRGLFGRTGTTEA